MIIMVVVKNLLGNWDNNLLQGHPRRRKKFCRQIKYVQAVVTCIWKLEA